MTDHLLFEIDGGIATLTMNRPEVRNALSVEMLKALATYLEQIEEDDNVRCVVLRGAGSHFMAGADIRFFDTLKDASPEQRRAICAERLRSMHNPIITRMRSLAKPIIASVAGSAAGGGMSYAMACDLVIASEDAFFVVSQIRIGAVPDCSLSYTLPRLVGTRKAMEIALLGDRIDAMQALELGLVNRVVANERLREETHKLAERFARGPRHALQQTKQLIATSLDHDFDEQLEAEAGAFSACAAGSEWLEGVAAFLEKRSSKF